MDGDDVTGGVNKPDMRVTVAGVELRSPVIAASGTFGYGVEFEEIVSLDRIGAFVTKGLSREPMAGNASSADHRDGGRDDERDRAAEHRGAGVCGGEAAEAAERCRARW